VVAELEVVDGAAGGGIATKVMFAPVKITAKRIAPRRAFADRASGP